MKIADSTVSMASTRYYKSVTELTTATVDRFHHEGGTDTYVTATHSRATHIEASGQASVFSQAGNLEQVEEGKPKKTLSLANRDPECRPVAAPAQDWLSQVQDSIDRDPKVQMLRKMMELLERITGRRFRSGFESGSKGFGAKAGFSYQAGMASYQQTAALFAGESFGLESGGSQGVNGHWTRQTVQSGFVRGEEHTAFSSVGTVVTGDGRTIQFGLNLEMSREFEAAFAVATKEEVFTDPLVINLDTDAAALSDVSFYFDLDCDGTEEEISTLDWGSGFLALDRNGDGKINDGSELFGAKTGDGFGELAQYDTDGNGWIDENDEIFSRLSVWTKCGDGEGKLLSLAEAGVGAIFLGNQGTQFGLADSAGSEQGVVRSTGVYLKENGQAGAIQHVDFKA